MTDESFDEPFLLQPRFVGIALLIIVILTIFDISVDLAQGVEIVHMSVEAAIIPLAALALYAVWRSVKKLGERNITLQKDLKRVQLAAQSWRSEAEKYIRGLSEAIDVQLSAWGLTASEKEVALLLLKGLSLKEVAEIRSTTERTAREQARSLYEKSGLTGRAEFAAFFLEDLLMPSPNREKRST